MLRALGGATLVAFFGFLACSEDSAPSANAAERDGGTSSEAGAVDGSTRIPTGATLALGRSGTVWVPAGAQLSIPFTIARNTVAGALTVKVSGLPDGVTAADVAIREEATAGTLVLVAAAGATLGTSGTIAVSLLAKEQQEDARSLVVRVSGPPGEPDATWGTAGTFVAALPVDAKVTVVRGYRSGPNVGKIVGAGTVAVSATASRIFVFRLTEAGASDTTFGDAGPDGGPNLGYLVYDPGANDSDLATTLGSIAIDGAGRIVVANSRKVGGTCLVELVRFSENGVLDAAFPKFSANLTGSGCGTATDVAVNESGEATVLANYAPDALLQSFTSGGALSGDATHVAFDLPTTRLFGIALDDGGRFLLAGEKCDIDGNCTGAVTRRGADRSADATFSDYFAGTSFAHTGFTRNGEIAVAGYGGALENGTIARLGATGHPATFGTSGLVSRLLLDGATAQSLSRPFVDGTSKIVFVGSATAGGQTYIVRGRIGDDGAFDPAYATNGVGITVGVTGDAWLGDDDRLVIAGSLPREGGGSDVAVLRFWP